MSDAGRPKGTIYDIDKGNHKAKKILAVLSENIKNPKTLSLLDDGCGAGVMTKCFAERFAKVVGIDVDQRAVEHASKYNSLVNIEYRRMDAAHTDFSDQSFDVVVCNHVYEHVSDSVMLMSEIYRLLKPGGVCYFAAGNRFVLIEPHYRLPMLSLLPGWLASLYLRALKKEIFFTVKFSTYWGLKKLVSGYKVVDYTKRIIADPGKYFATEMVRPGSLKQKFILLGSRLAYWLCPTYVWLLIKECEGAEKVSR